RCKGKVMLRENGEPVIHSLAHGISTRYELKYDAAAVRAELERARNAVLSRLLALTFRAVLSPDELALLEEYVKSRSKIDLQIINRELKAARNADVARKAEAAREHRRAARRDPRPELLVPAEQAPWLPVMAALNEVLGQPAAEPPTRDMEGY